VRAFVAGIGSAVAIGSCATSTGILPAGPDTYTLSEKRAPILGGGDAAEEAALTKAADFCTQKGLTFVPNNMGRNNVRGTGYEITFRCLPANDPAVAAYHLQKAPNIVIEQRNR
jgi:hypothetical protein